MPSMLLVKNWIGNTTTSEFPRYNKLKRITEMFITSKSKYFRSIFYQQNLPLISTPQFLVNILQNYLYRLPCCIRTSTFLELSPVSVTFWNNLFHWACPYRLTNNKPSTVYFSIILDCLTMAENTSFYSCECEF